MERQALFISDLHLDPSHLESVHAFYRFMSEIVPAFNDLYILGDFFECWMGSDVNTAFQQEIFEALFAFQNQPDKRVFFMPGNRDFLLCKTFCYQYGLQWLNDPSLIYLGNKPVVLSHGDLLCTQDRRYQRFRSVIQSRIVSALLIRLPLKWRKTLAEKLRQTSSKENAKKSTYLMDVSPDAVIAMMNRYNAHIIIHGHTHRPDSHRVQFQDSEGRRIVLGDWGKNISYAEYSNSVLSLKKQPFRVNP